MVTKNTPAKAGAPAKTPAKTSAKKAPAKNPFAEGSSKFAAFLKTKKLDARRILSASHQLEQHQREDRGIRLAKRAAKAGADAADAKAVKETRKPRSGRPITHRAMVAALNGGSLSGPVKTRILRAVNHVLEQKKAEKIDLRVLF